MSAGQWRYIAQRLTGDGQFGEFLDLDVPLMGATPEEVLSGHNGMTGTIAPEYARLKGEDGLPILKTWRTALWAESPDGQIWGGIVTHCAYNGSEFEVETIDLTGTLIDLPYTNADHWVNVDPIDLFRMIWSYAQSQPGGNLQITLDSTTSPKRLGTDLIQTVEFDLEEDPSAGLEDTIGPVQVAPNRYALNDDWKEAAIKALKAVGWPRKKTDPALTKWLNKSQALADRTWEGLTREERIIKDKAIQKVGKPPIMPGGEVAWTPPRINTTPGEGGSGGGGSVEELPVYQYDAYKLNWYTNFDLSRDVDDLAANTPFDWHMVHWWEGDEIRHHIRIGYPRLGRRLTDLRFVVGENIDRIPGVEEDGTVYANEVLFLGAGEGASQIMARARRNDGGIRKVATVSDPTVTTTAAAAVRAEQELAIRVQTQDVADVVLRNHPHAPIGSVALGDEILIEGDLGWIDLEVWCRVVGRSIDPMDSDRVTLNLLRTDRIG